MLALVLTITVSCFIVVVVSLLLAFLPGQQNKTSNNSPNSNQVLAETQWPRTMARPVHVVHISSEHGGTLKDVDQMCRRLGHTVLHLGYADPPHRFDFSPQKRREVYETHKSNTDKADVLFLYPRSTAELDPRYDVLKNKIEYNFTIGNYKSFLETVE